MNRVLLAAKQWIVFLSCLTAQVAEGREITGERLKERQPLSFIENKGQIVDQTGKPRNDVDFHISSNGVHVFIGDGQIHYQWANQPVRKNDGKPEEDALSHYRMDVVLVGANPGATLSAEEKTSYYEQYYLPGCGKEGARAGSFRRLVYKEVYPGIDWVFYIKDNTVEYDFIVRPGGKVSDIQLKYLGASELKIAENGALNAVTPMGTVREHAPVSYDQHNRKITSGFSLAGTTLSFNVAPYAGTLVIDPSLTWSTYFGGSGEDVAKDIDVDASGNTYITGVTASTSNIATVGSHQQTMVQMAAYFDAYLAKMDAAGVCQWATYYGGSDWDLAYSVACDASGNVYMAGQTKNATGIATPGAHQELAGGGSDYFLVKFNGSGVRQWGTYYGGSGSESGGSTTGSPSQMQAGVTVVCDNNGNIYLGGKTSSPNNIATPGSYMEINAGQADAFLAKFSSSGVRDWGTYFGGSESDECFDITADGLGNIYLVGTTKSNTGIATAGAYQEVFTGTSSFWNSYLAKFTASGALSWSTYLYADIFSVSANQAGEVCIGGSTTSSSGISTTGAYQEGLAAIQLGGYPYDAVLMKFSGAGGLLWGTYYGGSGIDYGETVYFDPAGNVYLAGASSGDPQILASPGAPQLVSGGSMDAFIAEFDGTTGASRIWGTYFGGSQPDRAYAIKSDNYGNIYLAGTTRSSAGIATAGSYQETYGGFSINAYGGGDAFLAKYSICLTAPPAPGLISGSTVFCSSDIGSSVTYSIAPVSGASSYTWTLPTGWTGTSTTTSIYATVGNTGGSVSVLANSLCGSSAGSILPVTVTDTPVIITMSAPVVCAGDTVQLSCGAIPAGYTYQWKKDGVNIAGAVTDACQAFATGSYTVTISGNGCTETSAGTAVTVNPNPAIPVITPSGTASFCPGDTVDVLLDAGNTPGMSYQWQLNGSDIVAAVSNTYTVADSGTYGVIVTDNNSCSAISSPFPVIVNAPPSAILTAIGNTEFCEGDSVILEGNSGMLSYSWQKNGIDIAGASSQEYTASQDGSYTVIVTDGNSCKDTSDDAAVVVNPLPVPVITANGAVLSTGSYNNYQWYFNGQPITNAVSSSYTVNQGGSYTVKVMDANGCSALSAPYVDVTGVGQLSSGSPSVKIYPNPSAGIVHIEASVPVNLMLYGVDGKLLISLEHTNELNISSLAKGLYLARISAGNGVCLGSTIIVKN